jgi:hypothetical protein|eukprot:scaffold1627_cov164-Alexandrium_tamarense.AAC.33
MKEFGEKLGGEESQMMWNVEEEGQAYDNPTLEFINAESPWLTNNSAFLDCLPSVAPLRSSACLKVMGE